MVRWLGLLLGLCLATSAADAQVFKPKGKKADKTEKKAAEPEKKSAKKQPRAAVTKKRVTTKPNKKNAAADRGRPDDLTPEPQSKNADQDYVKIWDDDD